MLRFEHETNAIKSADLSDGQIMWMASAVVNRLNLRSRRAGASAAPASRAPADWKQQNRLAQRADRNCFLDPFR